jgi:amidase
MRHDEYAHYDAVGLRQLMVSGEMSAAEIVSVAQEAIAWANERVNGLTQSFEAPLAYDADGPLGGVPFCSRTLVR